MKIGNIVISRRVIMTVTIIALVIFSVVGYSYVNSDLGYSATISVKGTSKGKLYDYIASISVSDSIRSDYVDSDTGINFSLYSSDTNGKGVYLLSSTASDTYPIYYYRGAVENNNVKFAGFCWKIVRTTDTGGTKLIYNGVPDAGGYCTNTTGNATQLQSTSAFNEDPFSLAYNGYMYGAVYSFTAKQTTASYVYGNTFTYSNGIYTLSNTQTSLDSTHHYTCFSSDTTCASISYVYYLNGTMVYYLNFEDGKGIEDAMEEMEENQNNSTMKFAIDRWFLYNFKPYFTNNNKDYNDYLEDTIWCNDRSYSQTAYSYMNSFQDSGWYPNGGTLTNELYYSALVRFKKGEPSLTCSNKNDSFTVTESATGNGALIYPVGLLTSDEALLAGAEDGRQNHSYYLYTGNDWWLMSTRLHNDTASYHFVMNSNAIPTNSSVGGSFGVRPSISLNNNILIKSGSGTSTSPYVIE